MNPTPMAIIHPMQRLNERRMLYAIAQVESGGKWDKQGAAGEQGAYQLLRSVWEQHMTGSGYSFELYATNKAVATVCAKLHLAWLENHLYLRGVPVTPHNIAICWRAGLDGGCVLIKHHRTMDSAERVQNIYEEGEP